MIESKGDIIIYNTVDGKASIALYAVDGTVWIIKINLLNF